MRALTYIYDSRTADPVVEEVLDRLDARDEAVEYTDVGTAEDPDAARREALLAVGAATRVGRKPSGIYDADGDPDFSAGVLITEEPTGRRALHVGREAVAALRADGGEGGESPTDG